MTNKKKISGVTLIEVLISIVIFGIITAIVFFAFDGVRKHQDLKQAANGLVSDFREIQTMALAGTLVNAAVPKGGYGLSIEACATPPCDYTVYGDLGNGASNTPPDYVYEPSGSQHDYAFSEKKLPAHVQVAKVTKNSLIASGSLNINVIPPKPKTIISDAAGSNGTTAAICLEHTQTHLRRLITIVAASGQVSEKTVTACP